MSTDDATKVLLDRVTQLSADADSYELIRLAKVVAILRGGTPMMGGPKFFRRPAPPWADEPGEGPPRA
jgi:hypothetical protein